MTNHRSQHAITAVVTSDNHLGATYARFRPDRMERRRRALQQNFALVVAGAIERHADLFLHCGDLFDRADPRNADRLFVARQVRRLLDAGIPVAAIAGNHDRPRSFGYDGAPPPHQELEALGAIHLFEQSDRLQQLDLQVRGLHVSLWGMSSDFGLPAGSDPLERCAHHRGADIDVVLLHYAVEGWAPNLGSEPCLPLASLEKLDTDAICVGHLHLPNQMRLRSGTLLMNPGATEHISFGEEALDCGFWVLSLSPGRAEAKYVALPTQPMRTISLNVPEIHDEQSDPLTDQILRRIEQASHPDRLLRVRLSGRLLREGFHELDLPRLQAGAAALNFHCQVETEELTLVDEWSEVPLGYGVSFDVRQELQDTLSAFVQSHQNDPETLEICRLAGDRLLTRYSELTGGSR